MAFVVSKMTQHYADNYVRHPEQFASGLGKKVKGGKGSGGKKKKKQDFEKRTKQSVPKPSKFVASTTQGPKSHDFELFVQGPVEWVQRQLLGASAEVRETLTAPINEVITYLRDEKVADSLKDIAARARDGSFQVLFGVDSQTMLSLILICFVLVLPYLDRTKIILVISLLTLYFTFTQESLPEFCTYLFNRVKKTFGFDVVQDDLTFASCTKFLMTCFAMWNMSVRFGEDATTFDKVHALARSFKNQTYKVSDMGEAIGKAQEVIRDSLDFVSSLFGLRLDTSAFQGESWFEIEQLNNSFLALKEQYDKRENVHSVASQLMVLEKQGMALLNRFRAGGPAYIQYRDAMMRIVTLRDELAKIGCFGNSTRQEPLFVIIAGQAGVGKSTVSNLMQSAMIKEVYGSHAVRKFANNDSGSFVYAPNQESKFLDGYNNQGIVLLDDFASSVEACQNWTQQIIHLVNTQPHQTPQASLERKGAVYFDSKFILATSNVTAFGGTLGHMYSKDAVARRMHLCLKVKVKPEFALPGGTGEPKVDPEAIATHREAYPDSPECFWLDWFKFDPLSGSEQPLCPCGLKCTDIEAYPDICRPASLVDALKLVIKTYRFRRDYELSQRARNKGMMEFLCSEEDTLDCIERAFTQGSCGLPFCYACAPDQDRRRIAVLAARNNHFIQGGGFDEFNDFDEFLVSWIEWRSTIRERIKTKDILSSMWYENDLTPICWLSHVRKYSLVDVTSVRKMRLDYTAAVTMWDVAASKSYLAAGRIAIQDSWRFVSALSFINKLCTGAAVVSAIALGYLFTRGVLGKSIVKSSRRRQTPIVTQSCDAQHDQVVRSLLGSNILRMHDEDSFLGYALGVGGSLVLMNKHIFYGLKSHEKVSFMKKTTKKNRFSYTASVADLLFFESESDDLVCVNVVGFHCQNIVHHLADVDVKATPSFNVQLTCWNTLDDAVTVEVSSGLARLGRPISAASPDGTEYVSINTIEYDIATENGQCGSLLTRIDPGRKAKVVGLHAAGSRSGKQGFGIIINKSFVDKAFEHFDVPVIQYAANTDIATHFNFVQASATVEDVQVVGSATPVSAVYKSEICKSPLYGELSEQPVKKPALLNPFMLNGRLFEPVAESLKEYSRGGVLCNLDVLNASSDAYIHELTLQCTRPKDAILSFEDSVRGCKDKAPYLKPINRGTASGSPSRFNPHVGTKKREAFGFDENYTFDTPGAQHIKTQFDEALEKLKSGPIPMVFVAFPKDELRPIEKVHQGKTRVVFSCDTVATLLIRRYFGCFASWYQDPQNRFKNSSAVGMNVADQFEVRTFLEKLGNGSLDCDVKAGDYSGFDKRLPSYVIDKVWDVFLAFFAPLLPAGELRVARNIFLSFTRPYIQYQGCLIEWDNSNPSGNPITTILNTICNNIVLRYAIARSLGCTRKDHALKTLKLIFEKKIVEFICYGDDNVWKIDKKKLDTYGFASITYASVADALREMGLEYTDEDKNALFNEGHRSVFDVSFLKRTLARAGGNLFMRLSLDTLVQNIQWCKKKDTDGELFRVKVEGFLDELSIHDDETWEKWFHEFYSAARRVDPVYNLRVAWGTPRSERVEAFLARGCEYW